MRGLAAEVELDPGEIDLDQPWAVNCDGVHTVAQSSLTRQVGAVEGATMDRVCRALCYAFGC
jgi:mRNA-degrading endonuclease toxin of MazEF toxin-antitoxin module